MPDDQEFLGRQAQCHGSHDGFLSRFQRHASFVGAPGKATIRAIEIAEGRGLQDQEVQQPHAVRRRHASLSSEPALRVSSEDRLQCLSWIKSLRSRASAGAVQQLSDRPGCTVFARHRLRLPTASRVPEIEINRSGVRGERDQFHQSPQSTVVPLVETGLDTGRRSVAQDAGDVAGFVSGDNVREG